MHLQLIASTLFISCRVTLVSRMSTAPDSNLRLWYSWKTEAGEAEGFWNTTGLAVCCRPRYIRQPKWSCIIKNVWWFVKTLLLALCDLCQDHWAVSYWSGQAWRTQSFIGWSATSKCRHFDFGHSALITTPAEACGLHAIEADGTAREPSTRPCQVVYQLVMLLRCDVAIPYDTNWRMCCEI